MEEHKETLARAVTLVARGPEASPLAQSVGRVGGAVANGLVDEEIDFDDAGGAVYSGDGTDGGDFTDEYDPGGIGHLVKCVFDGLGRRSGLLSVCGDAKSTRKREEIYYASGI